MAPCFADHETPWTGSGSSTIFSGRLRFAPDDPKRARLPLFSIKRLVDLPVFVASPGDVHLCKDMLADLRVLAYSVDDGIFTYTISEKPRSSSLQDEENYDCHFLGSSSSTLFSKLQVSYRCAPTRKLRTVRT